MNTRNAISTENLTIIPDVKPMITQKFKETASAPPFRDETVSEPERHERYSVNSFSGRVLDEDLKDNGRNKNKETESYGSGRPVRSAITPQVFDDRTDNTTISEYLFRFEMIAKANKWKDADKVDQIYHYLRGNAEKCYEDVIKANSSITWAELKNILEERFKKRNGRVGALEKMLKRKQSEDETFRNYFYDKLALIRQMDDKMKIEDKITYLIQGTKNSVRREVKKFFYDNDIESDDKLYSLIGDMDDLDLDEDHTETKSYKFKETKKDKKDDTRLERMERELNKLRNELYERRQRFNTNPNYKGNQNNFNRNNNNSTTEQKNTNDSNKSDHYDTKPKVRFERSDRDKYSCTYCLKDGHLENRCFKKMNDETVKLPKN